MGNSSDHKDTDRYRSQARLHASARTVSHTGSITSGGPPSTSHVAKPTRSNEAGGLDIEHGRGPPLGPTAKEADSGGGEHGHDHGEHSGHTEKSAGNVVEDTISPATPPPAPPPDKSEAPSSGDSTLDGGERQQKLPITTRMKAGCKRFGVHFKNAIFHSWVNVLLVAVPAGIAVKAAGLNASVIFAVNAIAIVPLAGLLSHATESVASKLGDTLGALLNVSFGNAVELIIFIIALVKNEISIVQASLLGSILANLLLILGMAFLFGGLRYREQVYNSTVTQMSACLLSLSVVSLLLPTAFHASFNDASSSLANASVLKVSRGTSVVLLLVYVLYLLFQLKSHAFMYESTPQAIIDEESHPGVLADILNSSSSSDDSSTSDSSDSDTSGSVITTGKRMKRMFKNRRRRKSSASVTSTATPSVVPSINSPSTIERQESYWEPHVKRDPPSRRESTLGAIASGDEADHDEVRNNPRIRDFGEPTAGGSKSPESGRRRRNHHKRKDRKRRHRDVEPTQPIWDEKQNIDSTTSTTAETRQAPKVGFADEIHTIPCENVNQAPTSQAAGRLAFNMRQLSSRTTHLRPPMPSLLSNNVFNQPAPNASPALRPVSVARSLSAADANGLRRATSMPERMNGQALQPSTSAAPPAHAWTDPVPPYQHQRNFRYAAAAEPAPATLSADMKEPAMSRTAAVVMLLCSTALVAVCAEFMVDAIPDMIGDGNSGVSEAFIGLIVLPIVGNAAEHVTAVTVATKNKMDLAIGVAVGSSIQIALFVTPIIVLLGWILDTNMSLYFNLFDTICLFVTAFVVNFLVLDGRSNYLEGSLLIAAYVIIALGAFFYPAQSSQSDFASGGGGSG